MSFKVGQKIKHPQHGVGIIKSIDGDSASIDFETGLDKATGDVENNPLRHRKPASDVKGVHISGNKPEIGESHAGYELGRGKTDEAVKQHKNVLSEMKQMPKPNLPKSEGMDKATGHEKGVHQPDYSTTYIKDGKVQEGISRAGIKAREAANPSSFEEYESSPKIAKEIHQKKLGELKQMPKPNLPKSEGMEKDDMPHEANSPEDKAHDIVEEGDSIQQALAILDTPEKQKQMFEHLRTLVEASEHRSDENQEVGQAPQEGSAPEMPVEEEKKEEIFAKSEYTPREVAIAVLKKAEQMAKEWQNSKPEKIMQDSILSEKRDVVNENDIIDAASQAMTDKSPLRLKAWVEARKAKK